MSKKIKGKRLEKWERDFYIEHRELIDIRHELTAEEQAELDLVAPSPAIAIDCGESEMYSVEDREAAIKEILLDFNKAAKLRKLVKLGAITAAEYEEITGEAYEA